MILNIFSDNILYFAVPVSDIVQQNFKISILLVSERGGWRCVIK